jgi:hypothetical protein
MTVALLYPNIDPSLLLDFANVRALDPRITFTRASSAVRYDGVTHAKAEENLLIQSQNYSSDWTVTNLTPITSKTAPDTSASATEFTASAGNATLTQSVPVVAGDHTFSVWLRRVTGTGNVDISAHSGGTWVTQTLTSTWTRFSVTQTLTAGTRTPGVRVVTSGDVIEVWGAQLEQRVSVTAYTSTTTQPITNFVPVLQTAVNNQARFDHDPVSGESLGLLIEEQRTNLALRSEEFELWTDINTDIDINTTVAPDGTQTADTMRETGSTSLSHRRQRPSVTIQAEAPHTFSVYAKKVPDVNNRWLGLSISSTDASTYVTARWNLDTQETTLGSASSGFTFLTSSITHVGNGWYRCSVTGIIGSSESLVAAVYIVNSPTVISGNVRGARTYVANTWSGFYIWGAQLEVGSFPTSYTKTEASQVTRLADSASMTGANFSSWYRQDEGTLLAHAKINHVGRGAFNNSSAPIALIRGTAGLRGISLDGLVNTTPSQLRFISRNDSAVTSIITGSYVTGVYFKVAGSYDKNNLEKQATQNGNAPATPITLNALSLPEVQLFIGRDAISGTDGGSVRLNGHIKSFYYYPQRLTNSQMQALTQS